MTGDRAVLEILLRQYHEMARGSEVLRARLYTLTISDEVAYESARAIARAGAYIDKRLDEWEARDQGRYIAALENVMRSESKNTQRGRFLR